jgi:hypothetical protein
MQLNALAKAIPTGDQLVCGREELGHERFWVVDQKSSGPFRVPVRYFVGSNLGARF